MNHKQLVKATNIIAILGILALIYWVFGFILIQVFGLKVFRQNLTEMFGLSVLGVLAVLAGSLILNIMLNLTRIAEQKESPHHAQSPKPVLATSHTGKFIGLGVLMFVVIVGGLFWGDHITSQRKFALMQTSANQVIEKHHDSLGFLSEYRFEKSWIDKTNAYIELMTATDSNINGAVIIMPDTIGSQKVYLGFGERQPYHTGIPNAEELAKASVAAFETAAAGDERTITEQYYLKKSDFIFAADTAKSQILDAMFAGQTMPHHSSHDGRYEMFYPYQVDGKTVAVLYLTDYQPYGKSGY